MSIVAIFDASEGSIEEYDQITQALEAAGASSPKGRIHHMAYAKDDGYVVVDIWESAESLEQFSQTLVPTINQIGGTGVEPQIYPLHNLVQG